MSDNSNLYWWTCIAVIAGLIGLNFQLYQILQESRRSWFTENDRTQIYGALNSLNDTLGEIKVDTELHQERERHHWRTHPGDRVIPGPGRGRGIGEPFGQPPLTEPEPEPTVAEEFRDAHDEGEDDAP